jgi:hypothetical protein
MKQLFYPGWMRVKLCAIINENGPSGCILDTRE